MTKWVSLYQEARARREEERRSWRRAHGGRRGGTYPPYLSKFNDLIDIEWLYGEMLLLEGNDAKVITLEEWEYARGCLPKVRELICSFYICSTWDKC